MQEFETAQRQENELEWKEWSIKFKTEKHEAEKDPESSTETFPTSCTPTSPPASCQYSSCTAEDAKRNLASLFGSPRVVEDSLDGSVVRAEGVERPIPTVQASPDRQNLSVNPRQTLHWSGRTRRHSSRSPRRLSANTPASSTKSPSGSGEDFRF